MLLLISSRGLLHGVMAGALVLASATACSRADRSETGLVESERIRPPEDSTELRGDGTSYETADEQVIDAVGMER